LSWEFGLSKSIIYQKSFEFSIEIVNLYKSLCQKNEYTLSRQLLKSGTSIGANVNEATAAQSKKDFMHKMAIASKEARETKYWLELLVATNYFQKDIWVLNKIDEIIKILTSIVKTTHENLTQNSKFKINKKVLLKCIYIL